jgi:MFS family permease
MFVLSRWAGRLVDRVGPRRPLIIGPLIAALGFAALAWPGTDGTYWNTFFPGIVVLGFGMAITVAPLTTTVMNAVSAQASGTASGINNAVSRTAGLLAVAMFGSLMAWAFEANLREGLQSMSVPPDVADLVYGQRARLAGIEVPTGIDASVAAAARRSVDAAFVAGFRWVMAVSAGLGLASALIAAFSIGSRGVATVKGASTPSGR